MDADDRWPEELSLPSLRASSSCKPEAGEGSSCERRDSSPMPLPLSRSGRIGDGHELSCLTFGQFRMDPQSRRLTREGVHLAIGGRAFDLLLALVENAGEVVTHAELVKRAWPGRRAVGDSALRFQMKVLRRLLGDPEHALLTTVAGRGYMLTERVRPGCAAGSLEKPHGDIPKIAKREGGAWPILRWLGSDDEQPRLFGRETDVPAVAEALLSESFLTIIGAGGVGKTALALAVSARLANVFDKIAFIDFSGMERPGPSLGVASAPGLDPATADWLQQMAPLSRNERLLTIFDSCEHAIETASALVERIRSELPSAVILAASREPIRAVGERLRRLSPLPAMGDSVDIDEVLSCPSIALFVERSQIAASLLADRRRLSLIAAICRRLDGIPLAIELAAARYQDLGLSGLSDLLTSAIDAGVGSHHQRIPPRHRSMSASQSWSFGLLSLRQQRMLCRLSVFDGAFSESLAVCVGAKHAPSAREAFEDLAELVLKSLVDFDAAEKTNNYSLLATTRVYALQRLRESGEEDEARRLHAVLFEEELRRLDTSCPSADRAVRRQAHAKLIGDIRAALDWCLSERGDPELAIKLCLSASVLFLEVGLLRDYLSYLERARLIFESAPSNEYLEASLLKMLTAVRHYVGGPAEDMRGGLAKLLRDTSCRSSGRVR